MSQNHNTPDQDSSDTPKASLLSLVLAFVVPAALIAALVIFVKPSDTAPAEEKPLTPEAVAERIKPVGTVEVKATASVPGGASGEDVFKAVCSACHTSGALGAPKYGDAAAWGPRIGQGLEALWNSAMNGKNNMPAQGKGEFTGDEIKRAVVYMANAGGATFEAPPVPAAEAASDAAPAEAASAP